MKDRALAELIKAASKIADQEYAERVLRERVANDPIRQAARAVEGVWRSVISGGWD